MVLVGEVGVGDRDGGSGVMGMSNTSWPAAVRADAVRERARAQAGDGSTTPSERRIPMRSRFADLMAW